MSSVRFVDELGVDYGIKHVGNKPRVSAMPYAYDIAEGNVPNHVSFRVLGYNAGLPNGTLEDITTVSANVPRPTTATAMEVDGASLSDVGATIYDSTATGGSATTLIDTGEDFTAGSVVAAGDMVILDDDNDAGIVTGVAATILTLADGFGDNAVPGSGANYRVVDVSAGGTGIQVVEVEGLDASYDEIKEFVVTNGQTAVATGNSYCRVNNFHGMLVGTGGVAAGIVSLQGTGGGTKYHEIAAGGNMGLQCHFTVPNGKTCYITDWAASASSIKSVEIILRATCDFHDRHLIQPFLFQDIMIVDSGGSEYLFPSPLKCPGKCDIKVSGLGIGGVAEAAASFGFWVE